jgi:hypothetical protein
MISSSLLALPLALEPSFQTLALRGANPMQTQTQAQTSWSAGRVNFENLNYLISVGDDSKVWVVNKNSQEQYLAWGAAQVSIDGVPAFSFSGNTSLALHDGTLLTLTTRPLSDDPLITAVGKVTITQGDYGVEIMGLHVNDPAGLHFVETQRYGWLLDAAVGDGNLIYENDIGTGFVGNVLQGPDGQAVWLPVDQAYIDATDLARLGDLAGTRGGAFVSLPSLMAITFGGIFRGPLAYRYSDWVDTPLNPHDATRDDSAVQQWRLQVPRDGMARWQVAGPVARPVAGPVAGRPASQADAARPLDSALAPWHLGRAQGTKA